MGNLTQSYLIERLRTAEKRQREKVTARVQYAPWVKDFQRRLAREENRVCRIQRRERNKVLAVSERVRELIMLNVADHALEALRRFEQKKF